MSWGRKGIYLVVLVLVSLSLVFAGCGGSKKETTATGDKKPIIMRYGHTAAVEHSLQKSALFFAEKVKEKTNGRVEVQVFPGGQLGGEKAQIEGLMSGSHDFFMGTQAPLSNWLPQFMALDMPYLITSEAQADKVLAGEVGKTLLDLMPAKGIYGLGWAENGFRDFTNSAKELHTPDDIKGMKIRVMENKLMIDTLKLWGADPTPMSVTDLYSALQQKTVDGQENPVAITEAYRFYEVQKYLTISHHFYSPFIFYASKVKMDKLPAELQKAIKEAALETCEYQKKLVREDNVKAIAKMEKAGIRVNRLTDTEIKAWAEKSRPVYEMYKDKMGADIYNKVMNAIK